MGTYIKARLGHVFRFGNKCGFGVHSPRMYEMITEVLAPRRRKVENVPVPEGRMRRRTRAMYRLVRRLADYERPERLYYADASALDFIETGRTELLPLEETFVRTSGYWLVFESGNRRLVLMREIHGTNRRLWKKARTGAEVRVDMMWYGLLIFDPALQKGNYRVLLKK